MRQQTSTVSQRPAGDDLELPGVERGSLEHNEVTAAASIGRLYVLETGNRLTVPSASPMSYSDVLEYNGVSATAPIERLCVKETSNRPVVEPSAPPMSYPDAPPPTYSQAVGLSRM